jgi:pentatricopeptide repeat protein
LALLREMSGRRREPDVVSHSASVSASEKGSQWARALSLLREMAQLLLQPDDFTYSASISACEWSMELDGDKKHI